MAFLNTPTYDTLAQRLVPRQGILSNQWVYSLMLALGGSWFVALCAQISIPLGFTPVPITLQTMGVMLAGSLLGTRLGTLALLLYVAQGAIGLPFFSDGNSGVQVLYGATAGYIAGFIAAAALVGWLAERGWDRHVGLTVLGMTLGSVLIYVPGVLWLSTFPAGDGGAAMGLAEAFRLGVLPFLFGAAVKIGVSAAVLPGGWKLLGRDKQRD
jgi:biotin transport system substrate-specific component